MTIIFQQLTNVEQEIVLFFVFRVMIDEEEWFENGIKELAEHVKRHEKSVAKAVDSLEAKNMVVTQKNYNKIKIKHILSDEELFTRMAFISHMFCSPQSLQELQEDLERENKRLTEEIKIYEEVLAAKQKEERIIESVTQQVTDKDLEDLANRILKDRTFSNVNKQLEEIIRDELILFRAEMFSKYGGINEEENPLQSSDDKKVDLFESYWSNGKVEKR